MHLCPFSVEMSPFRSSRGGEVTYAALDYAASAPALQRVWDDVAAYAPYYGSVHRGAGYLSQLSTDLFENARKTVEEFLDCRPDDQLIFTRSTTDSLNLLAAVLPADCQVFVFETEHHASLLPWKDARVTYLNAPRTPAQAVATLEQALAARDPYGPALVCVTGASNVTGELWPVRELAAAAHAPRRPDRPGRRPARPAPPGLRPGPRRRLDRVLRPQALRPLRLGRPGRPSGLAPGGRPLPRGRRRQPQGHAARGRGVDVEWHDSAARHEAGSPNVIGAYSIASACKALTEAGFDTLVAREQQLIEKVRAGLAEVPEVKILSLFGDDAPRVGVISFVVDGWNSSHFAAALSAEYGIGVRDGLFCAHPLLRTLLGTDPQTQGECGAPEAAPGEKSLNAIRVSFGAGTRTSTWTAS